MNRQFPFAVLTVLSVLLCEASSRNASKTVFNIPFLYPSRGIADGPQIGSIVIQPGKENYAVAQGLLSALQSLNFSSTDTKIDLYDPFPPGKEHSTDVVPMSRQLLDAYNSQNPSFLLPNDRILGLSFTISYAIRNHQLVYEIRAFLSQRGSGSAHWNPYREPYSGQFFSDWLKSEILKKMQETFAIKGST